MGIFSNAKIIGLGVILVGGAAGASIWFKVYHTASSPAASSPPTATLNPTGGQQNAAIVQTPAWYVAHRDALRAANVRCQNEGSTLPQGFCENVSIADHTVSTNDFIQALDNDKQ